MKIFDIIKNTDSFNMSMYILSTTGLLTIIICNLYLPMDRFLQSSLSSIIAYYVCNVIVLVLEIYIIVSTYNDKE